MGQTYDLDRETPSMVTEAIKQWHPVLRLCDVTIAVLTVADIDEETGELRQTLKCQGYPAAAAITITPIKQRTLGIADAVLVLDEETWDRLLEDEQMALLDHELSHLQVRGAGKGIVGLSKDRKTLDRSARLDDQRRPVLKMRKHDWQLGGFVDVARRHKRAAPEVQATQMFREPSGQYCWDFGGARIEGTVRGETEIIADLGAALDHSRKSGKALAYSTDEGLGVADATAT